MTPRLSQASWKWLFPFLFLWCFLHPPSGLPQGPRAGMSPSSRPALTPLNQPWMALFPTGTCYHQVWHLKDGRIRKLIKFPRAPSTSEDLQLTCSPNSVGYNHKMFPVTTFPFALLRANRKPRLSLARDGQMPPLSCPPQTLSFSWSSLKPGSQV